MYICDDCGINEALMDAALMEPLPLNEWAMATSIGKRLNEKLFKDK